MNPTILLAIAVIGGLVLASLVRAIEAHELFPLITLIEGSSIEGNVVKEVTSLVGSSDRVMVILDSNHTKDHVLSNSFGFAISW